MEPLNDDELKQALRSWQAPGAPASLNAKMLPQPRGWWHWLASGSVRVPVPLLLAAAAALLVYLAMTRQTTAPEPTRAGSVSLAGFQPVDNVEPQILRRTNENK